MLWAGVRDNYLFVVGGMFLSDFFLGSFSFHVFLSSLLNCLFQRHLKSFEAFRALAIVKPLKANLI